MIARELTRVLRRRSPPHGGPPRVFGGDDRRSSRTSTRRTGAPAGRSCASTTSPTARTRRSGARSPPTRAWRKAYAPRAAVLHAHDYPPLEFMRRYFDEYRGLRETIGHVEPIGVRSTVRDVRGLVAGDRRWMREHGVGRPRRGRWTGRSVVHHTGRKVFSALGVARQLGCRPPCSARCRSSGAPTPPPPHLEAPPLPDLPAVTHQPARRPAHELAADRARAPRRRRAAADAVSGHGRARPPPHRVRHPAVLDRLRAATTSSSSSCCASSAWDTRARSGSTTRWASAATSGPRSCAASRSSTSRRSRRPLHKGFDDWYGADVVVATGWQTVYPVLELGWRACPRVPRQRPRARVLSHVGGGDGGPRRPTARASTGSRAARGCATSTSSATAARAGVFDYGVDHDVYRPRPIDRRADTVVFYCRATTPRRAVPLGVMALEELHRRRPDAADRPVRRPRAARHPVPLRAHRDRHARSSSRGCTPRRRSASACR